MQPSDLRHSALYCNILNA